jgi:hypothetical protein
MTENKSRLPDLSGIIQKSDVFKKGSGSYSAEYVSWARIAHYLHVNANGWEFNLRMTPDGAGTVWTAPDNTGYVIGYFSGPNGEETADFPFPCMDNRNNPIPIEKVSCRVLTDTHRRALCACAAFTFGLGFELWAKAEVADAQEAEQLASVAKPAQTPAATPTADQPLSHDDRTFWLTCMQELDKPVLNSVLAAFRNKFGLAPDAKVANAITTEKHAVFLREQLSRTTLY